MRQGRRATRSNLRTVTAILIIAQLTCKILRNVVLPVQKSLCQCEFPWITELPKPLGSIEVERNNFRTRTGLMGCRIRNNDATP